MSTAPHDVRGRWLFSLGTRAARLGAFPSRGIATIEVTAVIAVTLVMIAVAASAYRTHSVRREVRATLAAVIPVQELVTKAFEQTGVPPASALDVPALRGTAVEQPYIETLKIVHGRIELRFGRNADESLQGRSLAVSPFETMDGEIAWVCGSRPPGVGLYPLGLFGSAVPAAQPLTTVDRRYLPPECR
jgi:type IV pilus assembly protein PilA